MDYRKRFLWSRPMIKRRIIKLAQKYGIFAKQRYGGDDYYHANECLYNPADDYITCLILIDDEHEKNVYETDVFYFEDYGEKWVIKRKKDIIKRYGRIYISPNALPKDKRIVREEIRWGKWHERHYKKKEK